MSNPSEAAPRETGGPNLRTEALLLRVAAAFGAYCVTVLVVLVGTSAEPWDTLSTVLVAIAALFGFLAWLCVTTARALATGEKPPMRLLARLAIGLLIVLTPVMALFLFWTSVFMQMANTGRENYTLFAALCIGAVLFLAMQTLILIVGRRVRRKQVEGHVTGS